MLGYGKEKGAREPRQMSGLRPNFFTEHTLVPRTVEGFLCYCQLLELKYLLFYPNDILPPLLAQVNWVLSTKHGFLYPEMFCLRILRIHTPIRYFFALRL